MAVFYQTYRPKNFSEVIGQESMLKALQNASTTGSLGHAYLFTGGRGLGKTTLARILAKATNCLTVKNGDPCGICEICQSIAKGNFLDVVEIDAASHTGVDNIRELIENIQFQPSYGKTKVFIIDEVHMLSKAAFNALLKTLEEPPVHALFILATTDVHKVPETIISRTQRFDFRSHTSEDIEKVLAKIAKAEKLDLPKGTIELIVENAEGGLRDALSQLSSVAVLPSSATIDDVNVILGTTSELTIISLLNLITDGNQSALPDFFQKLNQANFDALSFARKTLAILQNLLESGLSNQKSTELSSKFSVPQLLHVIRLFLRAYKEVDRAVSPDLPLLLASVEASMQFGPTIEHSTQPKVKTTFLAGEVDLPNKAIKPVETVDKFEVDEISTEGFDDSQIVVALERSEVDSWWPKLIEEVKTVNSPLATLLKNSPIHDVIHNTVIVAVKYLFHKEHVENTKHRVMISQLAGRLAGSPVAFKAIIRKVDHKEEIPQDVVLSDAIQIFGGELVD